VVAVEATLQRLEIAALVASQDLVKVQVDAALEDYPVHLEVVALVAPDEVKVPSHRRHLPSARAKARRVLLAAALLELEPLKMSRFPNSILMLAFRSLGLRKTSGILV
jgi:hypothetical protein